ncbi:MarR family winged helix-turn-helix transcriptional regulator [Actinomadura parmotrematis]|uniref:MarR family winged helix-turn-helix transcriptional regulator n=1 Tax=Actinomadura parmotrematis TaxID=2864039 RepID=A0ABS7G170_9ACTN|nr:MarR family winged helix-turn-helix transcriptional regulator [Actinomadura parmotrematis]MBW8485393.1 MarR family winged helix-turn-helix transcriptional regulator [Actinomadura parmotrematis]
MTEPGPAPVPDAPDARLGYLFKHAHARLTALSAAALEPFGITGRDLAVLAVLGAPDELSQAEAAARLGVDRTTMVALIDGLEGRGLVERRRSARDRRRNTVLPTPEGRDLLARAEDARRAMEARFLAPLPPGDAERLIASLRVLAAGS